MTNKRQGKLDLLREMNQKFDAGRADDNELSARINAYELAYRMQTAAPEAVDISGRIGRHQGALRPQRPQDDDHRLQLVDLARRLVERGVRFVQVYSGSGSGWDAHGDVEDNHSKMCRSCDKPIAGLLADLKSRGLLDDTLVVWGGEFGRTPFNENGKGRDHNPWGFTMWMAGGGARGGTAVGSTDEIGLRAQSIARPTSPTFTQPSSTCSVSITSSSPTPTTAAPERCPPSTARRKSSARVLGLITTDARTYLEMGRASSHLDWAWELSRARLTFEIRRR